VKNKKRLKNPVSVKVIDKKNIEAKKVIVVNKI
jgi:hypothetical protein